MSRVQLVAVSTYVHEYNRSGNNREQSPDRSDAIQVHDQ